jgi:hypothetical protein
MGFLSKKPSPPELQPLRPDLGRAIDVTPPKVSRFLLGQVAVLNYLNEHIPAAETVQNIVDCGSSMSEYLNDTNWYGCLVLTDKRLVVAREKSGAGDLAVLAWPFSEITAFAFEPINVRGVAGCDASIGYGSGQAVEVSVGRDTSHAIAFLQEVQSRLNGSGRYSL